MNEAAVVGEVGLLEYWLLYSLIVAGKTWRFAETAMARLGDTADVGESWFDMLERIDGSGRLEDILRSARTGNYAKLVRAIRYLLRHSPDLASATPEQLEQVPGIGPKTSRHFILQTRPGAKVACLDVHILRWLAAQGYPAPRQTPQNPGRYKALELAFLHEAEKRGMTPKALDEAIWVAGSGYAEADPPLVAASEKGADECPKPA